MYIYTYIYICIYIQVCNVYGERTLMAASAQRVLHKSSGSIVATVSNAFPCSAVARAAGPAWSA